MVTVLLGVSVTMRGWHFVVFQQRHEEYWAARAGSRLILYEEVREPDVGDSRFQGEDLPGWGQQACCAASLMHWLRHIAWALLRFEGDAPLEPLQICRGLKMRTLASLLPPWQACIIETLPVWTLVG